MTDNNKEKNPDLLPEEGIPHQQEIDDLNEFLRPPEGKLRERNPVARVYDTTMPAKVTEKPSEERNRYLDAMGNRTYYYQNISQGKIVISDLKVTIPTSAPVDMLDYAGEEDLLKSRDFRQCTRPNGNGTQLLRRMTSEEFNAAYTKYQQRMSSIQKNRDLHMQTLEKIQNNPEEIKKLSSKNSEIQVRPVIFSLVEKLRIGSLNVNDKEAMQIVQNKSAGITAEEFVMKIETMNLTPDEIDYVYQTVGNKTVRAQLGELFKVDER